MLYPINLNIENMKITIIGGGKVAYSFKRVCGRI